MNRSARSTAGFDLGPPRHPRRMSLTPMIDVVFLLLIFFMLASRFGTDAILPITGGAEGAGGEWQGAPRLVDVTPDGVLLNGQPAAEGQLAAQVGALLPEPGAAVILRADAPLQRLVTVMDLLRDGGVTNLILIE